MPEAPLEIVHLAHTFFPADVRVRREALAAAATGRRVAVVALRGPGEASDEDVGPLQVIRLKGSKSRSGPARYLWEYLAFVWRCRGLLASDPRFRQVRIVHVHTLPDFLVWAASPAHRRGARIILDLHEIFPEFVRAKYPGRFGRVGGAVAQLVERQARRRAAVTITVSRPIAELLASRGAGKTERIVLVHNAADPGDLGPSRPPVRETRHSRLLDLVYHGTLTHLYGLDIAIRGVAIANAHGVPARLTILGDGPERAALTRLVGDLDLSKLVSFESPVPATALRARLSQVHAGVVPTRLNDMTRYSLSNKLLEYVHLGVPVLAATLPSYRLYLSDDAAWFWTPEDPESLATAIAAFATTTPAERHGRPARAQEDLRSIAWEFERGRLIATYESLLGAA